MAFRGEHFVALTVAVSLHAGLAAILTFSTPPKPLDIKLDLGFEMVELIQVETPTTTPTPTPTPTLKESTPIRAFPPEPQKIVQAAPPEAVIPEIPKLLKPAPEVVALPAPEPLESRPEEPTRLAGVSDPLTADQEKALPLPATSINEDYIPPLSHSQYLHNPKPRYPRVAEKRGMEGVVMINVRVGRDGRPVRTLIHTSSGYGVLDRAALKAVRSWRFEAARRGNSRVEGEVLVPIHFELTNKG